MVPKVRQVIYQMAQFLTARKVALLKLLRLALAINQLSQLNGFSENSPPVDPTSTMARLLTDPSIYQQFIFEMIALIQSLEQHDLSNQSLKLAVGMDRVGYLVWRVRDALPARRVNSAKMEEFTVELTEFICEVDSIDALFDLFEGKISLQSHAKLIRLDIRRILEPAMKALHEEDEDQEEEELERQLIMTKDSCFGIFARQCLLAFNQLSFDSVVRLFVTFQQYVSRPALGEDERFYAPDARPLDISEYDADRFLDMQMELLAAHDTRAPPAPDLQYILKDIWARLPAISKVHYISCLNATRAGNYSEALESLHRYFDYGRSNFDNRKDDSLQQQRPVTFYQYALLNLGIIHAKFHNQTSAIAALQESIDLSRHYKDLICLKYAQSWMRKLKQKSDGYQLSLASSFTAPSSSSSTISTQSAGPAAVNLEVMNGIADIRSALASGRTAPNKVLQTIKRLVDLSAGTATVCNDNSTSNDASTTTSNAADRQLISEASLRAIDIAKANVYQYYGQDALVRLLIASGAGSSLTNDFINSRNSNCETADILLCRLVWMEFESGAISAQQAVAKLKQSQPSHTPLSRSRRFHVIHTIKHLLFQHYINIGQLKMAKILLQQLEALSAGDEQEQRFSVQMMSVELRCAYEDYTVAYRQLQDMLDRCGDTNYYSSGAVDRLRIMLKQAQLIINDGDDRGDGLRSLLIVLVRSDRVQMKLIYWEAILLLAKVHLQSGRAKQAKRAIESIYPQVLSGSSLLLESRAHFAYAKACMAADDDEANDGSKRDSIRKSTLDLLDRAASGFQRMFCLKELAAVLSMQLQILGQQQQSKQSHSQINSNSDEAIIAQRLATTEKQLLVNHCKIDSDWETIINVD